MLNIVFVSDYVCPYCLVAKEALKQALLETGLSAQITWQPYELTEEPGERVDTYHDETRRARYEILKEPCRKLGLEMKLPPKVVPRPYTRLAFEGWFYAREKGVGEAYNDLMYRAYFIEEQDIGDLFVLTALAKRIGLEPEAFQRALQEGTYSAMEKEAVSYVKTVLEPKGVPTLFINGERVMLKEYTKEELMHILLDRGKEETGAGICCGIDGCK